MKSGWTPNRNTRRTHLWDWGDPGGRNDYAITYKPNTRSLLFGSCVRPARDARRPTSATAAGVRSRHVAPNPTRSTTSSQICARMPVVSSTKIHINFFSHGAAIALGTWILVCEPCI